MNLQELSKSIQIRQSFLCVGLDPELQKLPLHLPRNMEGLLTFNRAIIEATAPYCCAYKLNTAFFEQYGAEGWQVLKSTLEAIPKGHFTIADAKRGDIGNTSTMYARAFFEEMDFDAITVAPYMGEDSIRPFLEFKNKTVIVLGLTSNPGSADFQMIKSESGKYLFEHVVEKIVQWAGPEQLMIVAGATRGQWLERVRNLAPNYFLLVPGVGAQGGDLNQVYQYAGIPEITGLLVNASRNIIYASSDINFAEAAMREAQTLQHQMKLLMQT